MIHFMKVMMTGSSGFVGSHLKAHLEALGHTVIPLPHDTMEVEEGCDALINLMGVPIAKRWTKKNKEAIYNSRVLGTEKLIDKLHQLKAPPKLFLSASAVGIYGSGFLAHVARDWERAAFAYRCGRVITMRFGLVLDPRGGVLKKMLPPFKWGLGGRLGSGRQKISWVALTDLLINIEALLHTKNLIGAVDMVAPQPIDNKTFTKELTAVLHRPALFPVPAWLIKLSLGETASIALDDSTSPCSYGAYEMSSIKDALASFLK